MPSVAEVVSKIEEVGLVVRKNPSKHSHTMWDIVDPKSGTILTGISGHAGKQGGDLNWHFNIRRILRKAGFQIEFGTQKKKNRTGHKRKPAIDLEALKKAQDQAAAAGHRIPLLDDLEDDRSIFSKVKALPNEDQRPYSAEAQEEVIDTMTATAEAPRVYATVQRLKKMLDVRGPELSKRAENRQMEAQGHLRGFKPGSGIATEFVRIAIDEVAPERNLRAWKSLESGQQTMSSILKAEKPGMSVWTLTLIEATMDHLDGLKWNHIDKDRIKKREPAGAVTSTQKKKKAPTAEQLAGREAHSPGADGSGTAPQGGPDQTTYDVAIALVEEYEEVFRQIAEIAGADGIEPEDWRALTDKAKGAKNAVIDLRQYHDEALSKYEETYKDLRAMNEKSLGGTLLEVNRISDEYATVLLDLLKNFEADKQGNAMLDMIFTRLDKLAGI